MTEETDMVCMPRDALDVLMEKAAEKGADRALAKIGLDDEHAVRDIKDMRGLLSTMRMASNTMLQTVVRFITIGAMALLFLGGIQKIKGG